MMGYRAFYSKFLTQPKDYENLLMLTRPSHCQEKCLLFPWMPIAAS